MKRRFSTPISTATMPSSSLSHWAHTHSRLVNVSANCLLWAFAFVCYLLLFLIFLAPHIFHLKSFITPNVKGISPQTAITLIWSALNPVTSAIVTGAVEQTLWQALHRDSSKLSTKESRNQAQWSVSLVHRMLYAVRGKHWTLRIAGITLVSTGIVSAVLVSGISQADGPQYTKIRGPLEDVWAGYIDASNVQDVEQSSSDVPGTTAALAYLSNLTAPASSICSSPRCSVVTVSNSIRASCFFNSRPFSGNMMQDYTNQTLRSTINPNVTTTIVSGAPYTYANFTSGYAPGCEELGTRCGEETGQFATIFGAFVNATPSYDIGPSYLNTVDCLLKLTTVSINQTSGNSPVIDPTTYRDWKHDPTLHALPKVYREGFSSPYTFQAIMGNQYDTMYSMPLPLLLLGAQANSSAEQVAQRIEGIFEWATLMAFSRSPNSSQLTIYTKQYDNIYVYNARVLGILTLPILATLLGTFRRWRVVGRDIVIGYDPVEISKRGPIAVSEEGNATVRSEPEPEKGPAVGDMQIH